jgi:hypothetical protein
MIDDKEVERGIYSPVCSFCKHHTPTEENPWSCKAFKEIPEKIWNGEHKHQTPVRGDKGTQFEKRKQSQ